MNEHTFGPMQIPIPFNAVDILSRFYGDDWNDVAYAEYDHREEKILEKIVVALEERAEVEYILPSRNKLSW